MYSFLLTDPFFILGQLFSDLASENSELLASLANFLQKPIHTLTKGYEDVKNSIQNFIKVSWSSYDRTWFSGPDKQEI
jgi:hypothetical protein